MAMTPSTLTPTQRYAAGALFAFALRQAQLHQTHLVSSSTSVDDDGNSGSSSNSNLSGSDADCESTQLWIHPIRGLLRPVFRFLDIDSKAWPGLEETAAHSDANHHIGAYLRIMAEEDNGGSSEDEQQLALAKSIDAMSMSLETVHAAEEKKTVRHEDSFEPSEPASFKLSAIREEAVRRFNNACDRGSMLANISINYPRKVTILFELLSACVADSPQDCEKASVRRKGYDARHRVALRLLATWLDINWTKMEAMEIIVAVSAMAANKEQQQSEENDSAKSKWAKWKRGGIIGAAALTGGALLAITGGIRHFVDFMGKEHKSKASS